MKLALVFVVLVAAAVGAAAAGVGAAPEAAPTAAEAQRATLTVRKTAYGPALFDSRGQVLYGFTRDRRGQPSRCYGDCARAWPVYFSPGVLRAGKGVKQSLIGTTKRRDGRRQVTYNGWPLYFYAHEGPGEVRCQNIVTHGGTWLVVSPTGRLIR
ncbi:MAG TPA: hypothetical protein VNT58_11995 [Gaiellaceae bacterium]|nr:hypothetical protein [Gaiellaceae bacterium]